MIVRRENYDGFKNFDFFNDGQDTAAWLYRVGRKEEGVRLTELTETAGERIGKCEACGKELFEGDKVLSFADGPIICAEHNKVKTPAAANEDTLDSFGVFSGGVNKNKGKT